MLWYLHVYSLGFRYDSEGKDASMAALSSGSIPASNAGSRSVYSDRVSLADITSNHSLGSEKVFVTDYCVLRSNTATLYFRL